MRLIIIESTCYKLTEKQFKEFEAKHNELSEMKLSDFLEANKHKYKLMGDIEYNFRL